MKRSALVCLVVGSLLAGCGGVPEFPGSASFNAYPTASASPAASVEASIGASPAASIEASPAASVEASPATSPLPSAEASIGVSVAPVASAAPPASPTAEPIGQPDPSAPLTGTVWQWLQTENTTSAALKVTRPSVYTIEFRDDNTIGIRSDCNTAGGTFRTDGSNFSIFVGPQSSAECPDGSLSGTFLRELPSITSYVMDNGTLKLAPTSDGGIMSFVPAP